jgi:protein-L-isoaspartate(D-aspartate) O-methyltransferase
VQTPAIGSGLVKTRAGWTVMAATTAGACAYLTVRPAGTTAAGERRYETGVVGHGRGGGALAGQVAGEISAWNQQRCGQAVRFEIAPAEPAEPATGRFTIKQGRIRLALSWHEPAPTPTS